MQYTTISSQIQNNNKVSRAQANENIDLYEVLNVPRIASKDEIRQAYVKMAKICYTEGNGLYTHILEVILLQFLTSGKYY